MYAIYVDGEPLYHPNLVPYGYAILNPKLTLEVNKAGSLTFYLPHNNVRYNTIQKLKSIITVVRDGVEIFRGRVLHDEKDFYNRKEVYCEGELSFFLDSIFRPYAFEGTVSDFFKQLVNNHNSQVDDWKQFEVGEISEDLGNLTVAAESADYSKTLDMLSSLVGAYGGYLRPRLQNGIRYLDYVESYGTDYIQDDDNGDPQYGRKNSQKIEFGKNLLDISEYIDAGEVFTVLIPLGADQGEGSRVGIASVNNEKDYIEDEVGIALFGRIWKTQEWNDIADPATLLATGKAYLTKGVEMAVSLAIKAADLHPIDVDTEAICIGDSIEVISMPHNIDKYFMCSKIVVDLFNAKNTEFTLGIAYTTMTEQQISDTKVIQSTITATQNEAKAAANTASSASKVAGEASQSVTDIKGQMTAEGIFRLLTNNGKVQGLILDEKTGDIYINATYIKSGTLTLGGSNPKMEVLDDKGVVRVTVDDDGIHILDGEVNATSGSLKNMTIVDGITISSGDNEVKDMSLVSIEKITSSSYGTYYSISFGESTNKTTPMAFYGSSIRIEANSSLTFSSDNIIFENSIEVPDIYITKSWTPLTLENDFINGSYEAKQLEYKMIGNHVYIRGSIKFPADTAFGGSSITVASLPSAIAPTKGNHYAIVACGGARLARILVNKNYLILEWLRLISSGENDTTITGTWVCMTMDYWID